MALIDDVRSLAAAIKSIPSASTVKVIKILLLSTSTYWKEEVIKHHTAMGNYPKGSKMYLSAQNAYVAAFQNWSRMHNLMKKTNEADIDLFSAKNLKSSDKLPAFFKT